MAEAALNSTKATFSEELATFARLLSDRLRSRAFDIQSEEGDCPQSNALELVADEIDEVLHEGPNPPEPKPRVECSTCHTIGILGDGGKCPTCKGKGYL